MVSGSAPACDRKRSECVASRTYGRAVAWPARSGAEFGRAMFKSLRSPMDAIHGATC